MIIVIKKIKLTLSALVKLLEEKSMGSETVSNT